MATNGTALPHSFEAIVVEINSIKTTVAQLADTVGQLAANVQARDRTPWGILIGFGMFVLTVMGGVGTLAYMPVKDSLIKSDLRTEQLQLSGEKRAEQLQGRIDMITGSFVTRAENDRLRTEDDKRGAIVRKQIDDDIKQLTESINVVTRTFVPRVEAEAINRLQEKLADERAKNTELRLNRHSNIIDRLTVK